MNLGYAHTFFIWIMVKMNTFLMLSQLKRVQDYLQTYFSNVTLNILNINVKDQY